MAIGLSAFALAGGVVSFIGWAADISRLTDWDNDGISIQPNATIAVVLAALAVLLLLRGHTRGAAVAGAVVAGIGSLTLFEYISDVNLGIDDILLFGREWGRRGVLVPGRMGPPGAASWTLIGCSIVLACSNNRRFRGASPSVAVFAALIASLSLIGYMYGSSPLYEIPTLTVIAWQTSTFILAVAVALILAVQDHGPMVLLADEGPAGTLLRRLLPGVILLPVVLGFLRLAGERAGLYDLTFGTAARTLAEIILLLALVWWTTRSIASVNKERVQAETALAMREKDLRTTLEGLTDGLVTFDREWRFSYVNAEAERLLQRSRASLVGQVVWSAFPEAAGSLAQSELERVLSHGARVEFEFFNPRLKKWFFNKAYAVADGVSVHFQDVTARKEAEQALRDADKRKDVFLATLAHELRNPLAPMSSAVEILKSRAATDPEIRRVSEIAERQTSAMSRLLDDLLDVGRIANDRLELKSTAVDLRSVLRRAVEMSMPLVERSSHDLNVSLPESPVWVFGDAVRLTQVVGNLLNNACRYTASPGHITLSLEHTEAEAIVTVRDNGIGIPPEHLTHIFEMFAQVDSSLERSHGGLGLGLHLVKRLTELHSGRVEARSDGPGKGSTFVIRIPTYEMTDLPTRSEQPAPVTAVESPSKRVLIVDDNADAAEMLSTLLEFGNYQTTIAHDGNQALSKADSFRPDAVLLDIGLPQVNGYDVCRKLRSQPWGREITVIAVTGWGQEADRARSEEAGFDHHLVKPIEHEALLRILSSVPFRTSVQAR